MQTSNTEKSLLKKSEDSKSDLEPTPDDILDKIDPKSFQIWKIFILSSLAWAITASFIMAGTFIEDTACHSEDARANGSTSCIAPGSMIHEFSLHGPRQYLIHWYTSAFMLGNIIGGSLITLISDQYGRKPCVNGSMLLAGITGCLMQIVTSFNQVLFLRVLQWVTLSSGQNEGFLRTFKDF